MATSTQLKEIAEMPPRPTTGQTNAPLLTPVLAVLGIVVGILVAGCSESFTPLEPEPEPETIPVFSSSPCNLISEVLVDIRPDSIWALEDFRKGARYRIPVKDATINWSNRTLDLVGAHYDGQTELHVLDGPGGNVIQRWDFYRSTAFGGGLVYYPLPTSVSPASLLTGNTMWVETRLLYTQYLQLRIVEPAVPYDIVQLPENTVRASLIHSSSGIGILALLRGGQLVELDVNGTLVRTWSSNWSQGSWTSSTFVEGQILFLFPDFLLRLGPEDAAPDTLAYVPRITGIASFGGHLYRTQRGSQNQKYALLSYDLEAVLTGSDIQAALQDSVALPFTLWDDLYETSDGALLFQNSDGPARLIYLIPPDTVVGGWQLPFSISGAFYDSTGLYLIPHLVTYKAIMWVDHCTLPPVLYRFPVTIDP
jgi:hypothetical protein